MMPVSVAMTTHRSAAGLVPGFAWGISELVKHLS